MDKSEVNAHIGRRLKFERRRRRLTQSDLADRCGVTFQQIQKYEAGLVTISAGMLWKLAEAMSTEVVEFFPTVAEPPPLSALAMAGHGER